MRVKMAIAALLVTSACSTAASPSFKDVGPARTILPARALIVPTSDHHQHLMSPAMLADQEQPAGPAEVALPAELAQVLGDRAALAGSSAPNDLYTEDAMALTIPGADWVQGRDAIQDYVGSLFRGIIIRPTSYSVSGSVAYIVGTARASASASRDAGNIVLALRRGSDGKWRIAMESLTVKPRPAYTAPITADILIEQMNDAGIERAVVLSQGYAWAEPSESAPRADEYERLKAENDWTAAEAARFPGRLVAFCGVNPLRDHAIVEIERCARIPQARGLKLHFGNSEVDLKNPEHVERMRRFFAAANTNRLAVVAHLMLDSSRHAEYGAEYSRIFLDQILPVAPDIPVQIAHMSGSGPGYSTDEALAVFAEAFAAGDPRMSNVYVDVATVVTDNQSDEAIALLARRMRQIGMERILFGSDMHPAPSPAASWATFRRKMPLTDAELRAIADNVAPYLR
jgi:predicted TIM-barrel fold metal-dependent hydrolase